MPVTSGTEADNINSPVIQTNQNRKSGKRRAVMTMLGRYAVFVALVMLLSFVSYTYFRFFGNKKDKITNDGNTTASHQIEFKKFSSVEDFSKFISDNSSVSNYAAESFRSFSSMSGTGAGIAQPLNSMKVGTAPELQDLAVPARVSETNVQVKGIDEPDILKTDGRNIFYSGQSPVIYKTLMRSDSVGRVMPILPENTAKTRIVQAFPPDALKDTGTIDMTGDLLVSGSNLIVISMNSIKAYNVSDPAKPIEVWNYSLDQGTSIIASRLFNNKLFVTAAQYVGTQPQCPIPLMTAKTGSMIQIACTDIYYPNIPVTTDRSYTVLDINPTSGSVEKTISFTGSEGNTTVYMSPEAVYVAYSYNSEIYRFMTDFLLDEGRKFLPTDIISKISTLEKLDISTQAKLTELSVIIEKYLQTLNASDRLKYENDYANYFKDYLTGHKRELTRTGIVKLSTSDLGILASGEIPGTLLNQFSLDEYQNSLRAATTIDGGIFGSGENVNDVYILDNGLNIIGSVTDMGKGERIYSARFIADRGYVVTFKQVDPFYILDLSDPRNPKMQGELKIPGYSSYLHPISDHLILGVGMETSKVKVSLFDVTNAGEPSEISKYSLNEYWSEAVNNHHAFLLDPDHQVFFIPGGSGGYILGYADNKLSLAKAIPDINVKRALYIGDYLYIVGDKGISVFNENNWNQVKELKW